MKVKLSCDVCHKKTDAPAEDATGGYLTVAVPEGWEAGQYKRALFIACSPACLKTILKPQAAAHD